MNTERRIVQMNEPVLARNSNMAERNRLRFQQHGVTAVNLVSSPGSGKTALLERTLVDLRQELRMAALVGDLATENDARRMRQTGAKAIQIITGDVCHLDADMVDRAYDQIESEPLDILFIENVGNLVCPASYDLGESRRIVLLSVTEGEDKPLKYPTIFRDADVVLITKSDIAAYVEYDRQTAEHNIRSIATRATLFELSAKTGEGMEPWYGYLRALHNRHSSAGVGV